MNYDCTTSIYKIFNALAKQTTFNKIVLFGVGCVVLKLIDMDRDNKKQREQIEDLVNEVNALKREKETNECNA